MSIPSLIGQVIFFNVKRGFGRLRSEAHPDGVFVHFSAIEGGSRVLVPHELVRYEARITPRGPRAERVRRLSPRLQGQLLYLEEGKGEILTIPGHRRYHFHVADWQEEGSYSLATQAAVEFSPFEQEAKEVIITDPRPALQRFAQLPDWTRQLAQLNQLCLPEAIWQQHPQALDLYLHQTFQRLQDERKVEQARDSKGEAWAAFHTGLHQADGQALYGLFDQNQQAYAPKSYLPRPRWQLKGFVPGHHKRLALFESLPNRAYFHQDPTQLLMDPALPLQADVMTLLGQDIDCLPETFQRQTPQHQHEQFSTALAHTTWRVQQDPMLATPIFFRGEVQLVLPLWLQAKYPQLGLVIHRGPHQYTGVRLLSRQLILGAARMIAPLRNPWEIAYQAPRTPLPGPRAAMS